MILVVILLIALFHLFIYYWNMDFHTKKWEEPVNDLSETKTLLEKHLNELKQYDRIIEHG